MICLTLPINVGQLPSECETLTQKRHHVCHHVRYRVRRHHNDHDRHHDHQRPSTTINEHQTP